MNATILFCLSLPDAMDMQVDDLHLIQRLVVLDIVVDTVDIACYHFVLVVVDKIQSFVRWTDMLIEFVVRLTLYFVKNKIS